MTDARQRMVGDFGRKISGRVEELMQRETDLARHLFKLELHPFLQAGE